MEHTQKPDCCADEHLEYLDDLRASGETNMFGARPYLMSAFPDLSKNEALEVFMYWMRAPRTEQAIAKATVGAARATEGSV